MFFNFLFSDVLFQSLLPCNDIKFNPCRFEHMPALLLYSIGRLSGITNEVRTFFLNVTEMQFKFVLSYLQLILPYNIQINKTIDNLHQKNATKSLDMFSSQVVMNIMDKISEINTNPSSSISQDLEANITDK